MKPSLFLVITAHDTYKFHHRATARAFAAACRMSGHSAIVKSLFGE